MSSAPGSSIDHAEGGRGRDRRASRGRRGRGARPARCRMGRGGHRVRGAEARHERDRARSGRALPRASCELQEAARGALRREPAALALRQGRSAPSCWRRRADSSQQIRLLLLCADLGVADDLRVFRHLGCRCIWRNAATVEPIGSKPISASRFFISGSANTLADAACRNALTSRRQVLRRPQPVP